MNLNKKVRKPDIIFFLNVKNQICYQRMKIRNQPKELFEKNLSSRRKKYFEAIEYLESNHGDNIEIVDASGKIEDVVESILQKIYEFNPKWQSAQPIISSRLIPPTKYFTLNGKDGYSISQFIGNLDNVTNNDKSSEFFNIDSIKK